MLPSARRIGKPHVNGLPSISRPGHLPGLMGGAASLKARCVAIARLHPRNNDGPCIRHKYRSNITLRLFLMADSHKITTPTGFFLKSLAKLRILTAGSFAKVLRRPFSNQVEKMIA